MLGQSIVGIVLAILLAAPGGDTRLPDAAMQGAREAVQSLLDQNVDVDAAQADGNTALHWAAYRDDMEMARLLIQADANVHARTRPGDLTPLLMAARNGSAAMIEVAAEGWISDAIPPQRRATPLMFAAASGNTDALRILLGHGAEVNATDIPNGQTALMFAARAKSWRGDPTSCHVWCGSQNDLESLHRQAVRTVWCSRRGRGQ